MLKKRLIFTLLYADGFFYLSRNFRLQKIGDIDWLVNNYNFYEVAKNIDELIILNISRDYKNQKQFLQVVSQIATNVFIPIALGGGIDSLEVCKKFFDSGADKVTISDCLHDENKLVDEISRVYGAQSIIAFLDIEKESEQYFIKRNFGQIRCDQDIEIFLQNLIQKDVGEIILNSINKDGTGMDFDYDLLNLIPKKNSKPIILSGGAGNSSHLKKALSHSQVDAVATANLLNFIGNGLIEARKDLLNDGLNLAVLGYDNEDRKPDC